MGAWQGSLTEV